MAASFGGIWPAILTPLTEEGTANHEQIEKLVELFVEQKLGGLYVLGSTGQWPLLSIALREEIAERVVKTAAGRIPIILHVGATATDDAVRLARHASRLGVAGISSVAPIYFPLGADYVFEHYRRIGQVSEAPLYVYHLSNVNNLVLDPAEYAERVLAIPNIGGMKITDRDLYQFGVIHTHSQGKLQLFSGADEVMCHAALSGAIGAIGTFYNLWGPVCQRARAAFVAGDFVAGKRFMLTFQDTIAEVLRAKCVWTFLRAGMKLQYGIDVGPVKAPLGMLERPLPEADLRRLINKVESALDG